jgi:hypothetical protein
MGNPTKTQGEKRPPKKRSVKDLPPHDKSAAAKGGMDPLISVERKVTGAIIGPAKLNMGPGV